VTAPNIHHALRGFCVSDALDTLGEDIATIREEDGLTWEDVGRDLGKCKDRARDYSKGLSEMPLGAFLLGCRRWNGRFAGRVLAMIGKRLADLETSAEHTTDRAKESSILKAALALSVALSDEVLTDEEIRANRQTLENASAAIDALLARIGPKKREDDVA
jgi:hypothetical protein